jgi:hypothetical protein
VPEYQRGNDREYSQPSRRGRIQLDPVDQNDANSLSCDQREKRVTQRPKPRDRVFKA